MLVHVNGKLFIDEDFLRNQCGCSDSWVEVYTLVLCFTPWRVMPAQLLIPLVAEQDD